MVARVIFWLAVAFLIVSVMPEAGRPMQTLAGGLRHAGESVAAVLEFDFQRARLAVLEGRAY